jgi:hypothetical protein
LDPEYHQPVDIFNSSDSEGESQLPQSAIPFAAGPNAAGVLSPLQSDPPFHTPLSVYARQPSPSNIFASSDSEAEEIAPAEIFSSSGSDSDDLPAGDIFNSSDSDPDNPPAADIFASSASEASDLDDPLAADVFASSDSDPEVPLAVRVLESRSDDEGTMAGNVFASHFDSDNATDQNNFRFDSEGRRTLDGIFSPDSFNQALPAMNVFASSESSSDVDVEETPIQRIPGPFNARFFSNFPESWMGAAVDDVEGDSI